MAYKFYFLVFLLFTFFIQNCFAKMGTCAFAKGNVTLARNGKTIKLVKDSEIHFGDVINTGPESIAILVLKNASLKIEPKTTMKINGDTSTHDTNVEVNIGSMVIRKMKHYLHNNKNPEFKVSTKHASMGVRGTLFYVYQGKNPQTTLSVNNGEVAYQSKGSQNEILVSDNSSTMGNFENKNLKPRQFGFEEKINFNLDQSKPLESAPDLTESIEKAWLKYKHEQEYQWQKKLNDEEKTWDNWKQDNTQQEGSTL